MILLDGKSIAENIEAELRASISQMKTRPRLAFVMVGRNKVSEKFVTLKEKFAEAVGVETRRYEFEENITTNELRSRMNDIVHEARNDGVIVQLPLPEQIDSQSILNTVVPEKDVDVLSARAVGDFQVGKEKVIPPVALAVQALFDRHAIDIKNKKVIVLGYGRLVGQPLSILLLRLGAQVTIFSDETQFDADALKNADIVISGIGKAKYLTGDMVRQGIVVVDVGTSEIAGEVVGDVDFDSVSKVAGFLTPIKGGVGPLTVAFIFKNLLALSKTK